MTSVPSRSSEPCTASRMRSGFSPPGIMPTLVAIKTRSRAPLSFSHAPIMLSDSPPLRSEEHTSELQSLMRISYAVFCLKKKKQQHSTTQTNHRHKYKLKMQQTHHHTNSSQT